jgi:hypothetical protein
MGHKGGSFLNSAYIGFVKKVDDGKRAGRIQVWIPEFKSAESDPAGWIQCEYCSPFAGVTNTNDTSRTVTDTNSGSQTAYGFFATIPDLNNEVIVMFIGGDVSKAIWIGGLYGEFMMHQVPAIAASSKNKQTSKPLPVTEYNKWDTKMAGKGTDPVRPWNEARTNGIGAQGLISDNIRGLTSSSAMRESPSSVYGLITPGRKKGKSRTGGHSFVMDDGDAAGKDSYIGFRTTNGASLRIDDTNGLIYAINAKGTAWIQMDADGNVDIFGAKSISVRAQEDINLRADKNINIEAGQDVNIKANKDTDASGKVVGEGAGVGGNLTIEVATDITTACGQNQYALVQGTKSTLVGADMITDAGTYSLKSSNINVASGGAMSNTGTIKSTGIHYAPNFQTPGVGLIGHIHGNSPPAAQGGGAGANAVGSSALIGNTIVVNSKTNVLAGFEGTVSISLANSSAAIPNFWGRKTESMETIVSRLMTYEPCPEHVNKGQ